MDREEIEQVTACVAELMESSSDSELFHSADHSPSSSDAEGEAVSVVPNFVDTIENYCDEIFRSHFRLKRSSVDSLIDMYSSSEVIREMSERGRQHVGARTEIYLFLWYITTTNTFRELGNKFTVAKSTAWTIVVRVSSWIVSIGHNYIQFPTIAEVPSLTARWEEKTKIPYVIGAIDCTHILINAPREQKECYFNRKQYYSIHLQAVVDVDKRFRDIYVGEPGSLRDYPVLRRSELFSECTGADSIFAQSNCFLLGDLAYPLTSWLVPPIKDNNSLPTEKTEFNKLHSSARILVEHAFGMLKKKFRRIMHFTEHVQLDFVVNLTIAACVLHNICISENDTIEAEIMESESSESDNSEADTSDENDGLASAQGPPGVNRHEELIEYLLRTNRIRP